MAGRWRWVGPLLGGVVANAVDDTYCNAYAFHRTPVGTYIVLLIVKGSRTRSRLAWQPAKASASAAMEKCSCDGKECFLRLLSNYHMGCKLMRWVNDNKCDYGSWQRSI